MVLYPKCPKPEVGDRSFRPTSHSRATSPNPQPAGWRSFIPAYIAQPPRIPQPAGWRSFISAYIRAAERFPRIPQPAEGVKKSFPRQRGDIFVESGSRGSAPQGGAISLCPIGQFLSRLQLSLNAKEYCTPLGCGCRNTRFYKYATPLG
jgi:hypothetical protein